MEVKFAAEFADVEPSPRIFFVSHQDQHCGRYQFRPHRRAKIVQSFLALVIFNTTELEQGNRQFPEGNEFLLNGGHENFRNGCHLQMFLSCNVSPGRMDYVGCNPTLNIQISPQTL